jgi:ABC-type sugar transport system ATPase subunit
MESSPLEATAPQQPSASPAAEPAHRVIAADRDPVLVASGLTVARGKRPLLENVDLSLHRGEVVVVLGPNGVGKSTLLSVLAGLLPSADGTVQVHGRVAAALQAPTLADRSVRANLNLAMSWWGVPRADRAARADDALALLRIEHLADRLAETLSGGEARRVHLARALSLRSDVLMLDEPFAGLDPPTKADLLGDASTALRHEHRATLVVVHDRGEAWALADRLIVLLGGAIAAEGDPQEVLEQPANLEVARFLGFTGSFRESDGRSRYVRPAHVALDQQGLFEGSVTRRVHEEDGVLCEVTLTGGVVQVRSAYPGPEVGHVVRLRIDGGARF